MVQGPDGPVQAKRPSDETLEQMASVDRSMRLGMAIALAEAGFTLDAPVDVNEWDYWKTMAQRRRFGFTWVPAGHMANVLIAPGLPHPVLPPYDPDSPPEGAILVPASDHEDPNYEKPEPVEPSPPEGFIEFGPPADSPDYPGAFLVGANNTAKPGILAKKDGVTYVYVEIPRLAGALKLWVPVAGE
jgi:hypothetical protein